MSAYSRLIQEAAADNGRRSCFSIRLLRYRRRRARRVSSDEIPTGATWL